MSARLTVVWIVALLLPACGSEQPAASGASTSIGDASGPGSDMTTTSRIPTTPSGSPPTAHTSLPLATRPPPTTTPDVTTDSSRDNGGVPLSQILEPFESDYVARSDFTLYELDCSLVLDERLPDGTDHLGRPVNHGDWAEVPVDRAQVVGRGSVLSCSARTSCTVVASSTTVPNGAGLQEEPP